MNAVMPPLCLPYYTLYITLSLYIAFSFLGEWKKVRIKLSVGVIVV